MAENRQRQEELKKQAAEEAALKQKAVEAKLALDVTKNEFVTNALRFAIMRARQQKVIEQTKIDQQKLEASIQ